MLLGVESDRPPGWCLEHVIGSTHWHRPKIPSGTPPNHPTDVFPRSARGVKDFRGHVGMEMEGESPRKGPTSFDWPSFIEISISLEFMLCLLRTCCDVVVNCCVVCLSLLRDVFDPFSSSSMLSLSFDNKFQCVLLVVGESKCEG